MTLQGITPRWEWRTFQETLAPELVSRILDKEGARLQTRECYILTAHDHLNIKLRYDLLDVKERLLVQDGLELWAPIEKCPLPLDDDGMATLARLAGLDERQLFASAGMEDDLRKMVHNDPALSWLDVEKLRFKCVFEGTWVDLTKVMTSGSSLMTLAFEHEKRQEVHRWLEEFNCSALENVNYVRCLKRIVEG